MISYSLATKPEGEISLEILDADGRLVRRLSSVLEPQHTAPDHPDWDPSSEPKPALAVEPGINRAVWDLRHEQAKWVPGGRIDSGEPAPGPLALPGDYSVRLTADGRSLTQPLRVDLDPRSSASASDLEAQLAFELEVRDQLTRITDMVETIRSLHDQLEDRGARLAGNPEAAELIELGSQLNTELDAIEEAIHSPDAEVAYDILAGRNGGAKLYSRLSWLFQGADEHDGPPTQGMREVFAELESDLEVQQLALETLLSEDLAKLNALAAETGVPYVMKP